MIYLSIAATKQYEDNTGIQNRKSLKR